MKTRITICIAAVIIILSGTAFKISGFQPKPWIVPEKNAKMINASPSNAATIKDGKELWVQHCQSCHGKSGKGDGPKAAQLKTESGNFTLPETQKQTDGSIFYKISEGRGDMPAFKKKIPEAEDIWNVINFIRTLKG